MKAMILAAGRAERLRPLTDHTPKPLVQVGGQPLIGHHLKALARAGITDIVINVAWLAGCVQAALGDGRDYGVHIRYSVEQPGRLDTGGGVRAALRWLGNEPFMLVSADVLTDFDYSRLPRPAPQGARLLLVNNPPHHPDGDFGLNGNRLTNKAPRYTYGGIGVYDPQLFKTDKRRRFPLADTIRTALANNRAHGVYHDGLWLDVGRPQTLQTARAIMVRAPMA